MNRAVLVTGAGGGLGLEIVKEHAKVGDTVYALTHHDSEELKKVSEEHPGLVEMILCDIGSTESVERALEQVKRKTAKLDRLFNNAGIHRFKDWVTLEETELDYLPIMYNVNAVGPLRVVKAALPLLTPDTVIINISSEAASLTNQDSIINYAYSMSKAGMNMGARVMDNWLREKGIRTIMIHPGRMRTGMKGSHSNMDPWETSASLMVLLDRLGELPKEQLFMDYKGNPMAW